VGGVVLEGVSLLLFVWFFGVVCFFWGVRVGGGGFVCEGGSVGITFHRVGNIFPYSAPFFPRESPKGFSLQRCQQALD